MARPAPTGTVTLMFTDVVGSSSLWDTHRDGFRPILDRHHTLIRAALDAWEGFEVKTEGDAFMVAFARPTDAIECAIDIQAALEAEPWPAAIERLQVRIGLHTGEPFVGYAEDGAVDYLGPAVNRAARVCAAGHGGQILLSAPTWEVARDAVTTDVSVLDLGIHRLRGLERPERLFQVLHPRLAEATFPALRTADVNALPGHLVPMVGRQAERRRVGELLQQPDVRLLTLVGPVGIGKTRLALATAADQAMAFDHGLCLVELAAVHHADEVPAAILRSLGIGLNPGQTWVEQLLAGLRGKSLLLVLDNCEHVAQSVGVLAEVVQACPHLKVLATSLTPLGLLGEQVFPLGPLTLPPAGATAAAMAACESVQLFVERAQRVDPAFELAPDDAAVVAAICGQLDGIPLAIQMAAERVAVLSLPDLRDRLFDVVGSKAVGLPDRQRTLHAAVDWALSQLNAPERDLLATLSLFRGGFDLDSAEALCGQAAPDVIAALGQTSLLQRRDVAGQRRFYLLQSARPALSGDVASETRARFIAWFTARLEQHVAGPAALAERWFEREADNVKAAWELARAAGDAVAQARLALAAADLLRHRGAWQQRREWLALALAAHEPHRSDVGSPELAARLAELPTQLGYAEAETGELAGAQVHLRHGLAAWQALGDTRGQAACLHRLGAVAHQAGDLAEARSYYQTALDLRRQARDTRGESDTLNNLGVLTAQEGDLAAAEAYFGQSLALDRQRDDTAAIALMLNNLGRNALDAGRLAEAEEYLEESRELKAGLGDRWGLAHTLHNLGELAAQRGQQALAHQRYRESLDLRRALDGLPDVVESLTGVGALLLAEGRREDGALLLAKAARESGSAAAARPASDAAAQLGPEVWARAQRAAERISLEAAVNRALWCLTNPAAESGRSRLGTSPDSTQTPRP